MPLKVPSRVPPKVLSGYSTGSGMRFLDFQSELRLLAGFRV